MNVIPSIDRNTVFISAGLIALRHEDGSFESPRTLYLAASREELTADGLLQSEQEQINNISSVLAQKFREYQNGIRQIQRLQQKGERTW